MTRSTCRVAPGRLAPALCQRVRGQSEDGRIQTENRCVQVFPEEFLNEIFVFISRPINL